MDPILKAMDALIHKDYERRVKKFNQYELGKDILMIGDSLIAYWPMSKFNLKDKVYNLGIPGDTTLGVLNRIEQVYRLKPKTVIIQIGINDFVFTNHTNEEIYHKIMEIADLIEKHVNDVKIYLINITPINKSEFLVQHFFKYRNINDGIEVNELLSKNGKYPIIDLRIELENENKELKKELSTDGIHYSEKGYEIYLSKLKEVIKSL